MQLPGAVSIAFLAYILILLPLGARRSARALAAGTGDAPEISRT